jgi:hypothetical protein
MNAKGKIEKMLQETWPYKFDVIELKGMLYSEYLIKLGDSDGNMARALRIHYRVDDDLIKEFRELLKRSINN